MIGREHVEPILPKNTCGSRSARRRHLEKFRCVSIVGISERSIGCLTEDLKRSQPFRSKRCAVLPCQAVGLNGAYLKQDHSPTDAENEIHRNVTHRSVREVFPRRYHDVVEYTPSFLSEAAPGGFHCRPLHVVDSKNVPVPG